jgi:hypothetical protein
VEFVIESFLNVVREKYSPPLMKQFQCDDEVWQTVAVLLPGKIALCTDRSPQRRF